MGILDDSYSKALLHFDGADASTTFTDESGKTWSASGHAQIDTAQSEFGGASGLFDGTDDYIASADSDDWDLDGGSNANAWTIDFWVRFSAVSRNHMFCEHYQDVNTYWRLWYDQTAGKLRFQIEKTGILVVDINPNWSPSVNTWYHVAVVKNGTGGYSIYIDGTSIIAGSTDTDVMPTQTGSLTVGGSVNFTPYWLAGWIDELRISKGIARWTADFTIPTEAYGFLSNAQVTWWG